MTLNSSYDVIIIGGAVVGSSVAYWLANNASFDGTILVVEPDATYVRSSTALSAASIRLQYSNPVNVQISKFGVDFIRGFSEEIDGIDVAIDLGFKENGYLFLAGSENQAQILRENAATQREHGAETQLLQPDELGRKFEFLNTTDIVLGSFGARHEGWFDNMGLLNNLRRLAQRAGAAYIQDEVVDLIVENDSIQSVTLKSGQVICAGFIVNAAGTSCNEVAAMAKCHLPVQRRKRTTFAFETQRPVPGQSPLFFDHSGVYARPEGAYWITACQPADDPQTDPDDFEPRHQEFEDIIWPALANRSSYFEAIKQRQMWAGHYAYNTLDQNAVVGFHPKIQNFIFANGFSGHGLQQAPAVGRAVSELVTFGGFRTLDLSSLGYERIVSGDPFLERCII